MARTPIFTIVLLVVGVAHAWCQQPSLRPSLEVGGFGALVGDATVPLVLPGVATPPVASFDGSSSRLALGGMVGVSLPVLPWLSLGTRLSAQGLGVQWNASERLPINVADTVYLATVEHRRNASGTRLDVVGFARITPWSALEVDVGLGLPLAVAPRVTQTQRFRDPEGIRFADGSLEQETGSATLTTGTPLLLDVRASWPIPVWSRIDVVPWLGLRRDLSSALDGASWTTQQLFVGVGARIPLWAPNSVPAAVPKRVDTATVRDTITVVEARPDTTVTLFSRLESTSTSDTADLVIFTEIYQRAIPRPAAFMEVSLSIDFVYSDGVARSSATVKPTRVARVRTMPLFPVIVFDEGGTDIAERYLRRGKHVQHQVLQIAADSMRASARRRIDVVGYHDGTQPGAARAQLRAEAVAAALRGRGVARAAMGVRNTVAPARAYEATVELRIAPDVQLRGQTRENMLVSDLPVLRVRPDVVSDEEIVSWSCAVRRSGQTVYEVSKQGPVPEEIRWPMGEMTMEAGASAEYEATISVTGVSGTTRKSDDAKVTVQAVTDGVDAAPMRLRIEEVVLDGSKTLAAVATGRRCMVAEVYAGCTEREVELYQALGGATFCPIIINEERKP